MLGTNLGVLLIFAFMVAMSSARVTYKGYSVIRCTPENLEQLELLKSLQSDSAIIGELDFWTPPIRLNQTVDIMVGPKHGQSMRDLFEQHSIFYEDIISDLDDQIQQSMVSPITRQFENNSYGFQQLASSNYFNTFHRYAVIEEKLRSLAEMDSRVSLEVIGKSSEGRNMYLVKVASTAGVQKPIILIDSGHHAREWISHSTLMYLLESMINPSIPKLAAGNCRTPSCRRVVSQQTSLDLENYDYWFVPVINPDGYEYTHTSDRLWRKTRSRESSLGFYPCYGVDPNRNYDVHWSESGASRYSCADTYPGPRPFSEPETRVLAKVMDNNVGKFAMYLSLHAYSQMILTPYGHRASYPKDYKDLEQVAKAGSEAIGQLRGTAYQYGPSAVLLYPASGASDDYAYSKAKIKYAYTMELPDTGKNGFVLPPSEIIPVGHETLLGLRSMTDKIIALERDS